MKYVRLKSGVRLINYGNYFVLFDNGTASEFLLDEMQAELVGLLDGTSSLADILKNYDYRDRDAVSAFIRELVVLGYVKFYKEKEQRLVIYPSIKPYLEGVLFDITSECNLACNHCYVSKFYRESQGEDLSFIQVCRVVDDLANMNVRDIAITGGEPSARRDIYGIIGYIIERGIHLSSFFTNGLRITDELVICLAHVPQKVNIYISLDGLTSSSHAVIRGNSIDADVLFKATLLSIERFVAAGLPVVVNTSLHSKSLEELPKMYSLLKKLGVKHWRMAVPKPLGRYKRHQNKLRPAWHAVLSAYERLLDLHLADVAINHGKLITPMIVELELLFRTDALVKSIKLYQPGDVACFYHRNRCSIKANGDVIPCGYYDSFVIGNVKHHSIQQLWLSSKMQNHKELKIAEVNTCSSCPVLNVCGTGCRALAERLTGSCLDKDEYACSQIPLFQQIIFPKLLNKYGFVLKKTTTELPYLIDEVT